MNTRFPSEAILLAAGLGTRMRPLTETMPKPLVPVGGLPLIERVVINALAEGITGFAVNVHYRADQLVCALDRLSERYPEARFKISNEEAGLLDTGGGAQQAAGLLAGDPLFVFNTDSFWPAGADRPLHLMAADWAAHPEAIVLLCADPQHSYGFDRKHDFFLAADGTLTLDRGAPMIFAGVSLIPRQCLDTGAAVPWSLNERFHIAAGEGRLRGVRLDAPWLHVGDPDGLAAAERLIGSPAA